MLLHEQKLRQKRQKLKLRKKVIKEPMAASFITGEELDKEKVLSVRISKGLYQALENTTKANNMRSVSDTIRTVLTFYYLPKIYEMELKHKKPVLDRAQIEQFAKENHMSIEQARANYFTYKISNYLKFLEQAYISGKHSMEFIEKTRTRLNSIFEEVLESITEEIEKEEPGGGENEQA